MIEILFWYLGAGFVVNPLLAIYSSIEVDHEVDVNWLGCIVCITIWPVILFSFLKIEFWDE